MIRLECSAGGHNKFYELDLVRTNGHVVVKGLYGRIGQAGQDVVIYDGDSEEDAKAEMQKRQLEKVKKGYVIVSNGNGQPVLAENKKPEVPVIWPMNAVGIKDESHLQELLASNHYMAQEKLDGMRAVVHVTKAGLRILSRSAGVQDPSRPLEKTQSLPHLARLDFPGLIGTILDCEILARNMDSATLAGSIHSKDKSNGHVMIHVFDVLHYCGTDLMNKTLFQRFVWLLILKSRMAGRYIEFLPWATSTEEKQSLYRRVMSNGGEGIMLKNLHATYLQGGRPVGNWWKAKRSATFDCVVTGFTKGKGKFNERIGAVIFGQYVNGKLMELGQASGMTEAIRNDMSHYPQSYIGRVIVIKGMERLKSGAIRHPQFVCMRADKQPHECIWYQGER